MESQDEEGGGEGGRKREREGHTERVGDTDERVSYRERGTEIREG